MIVFSNARDLLIVVSIPGPSSSQFTEITDFLIDYFDGPLLPFGAWASDRNYLADIVDYRVFTPED